MIIVDRVSKYYGAHPAVRDLDFKIEEGECVGFLGLNGAGKTTTLRLLSCLLLPTAGRITVKGFDAEEQPHEIRKLIGYLPDKPPVYPEMRVDDYVRYTGRLRQMSKKEVEARLPEVLDLAGLKEVASQTIGTLSHGYRQRVGIAQAIVHRPSLLILDEPINGLDPVQIREMRDLIRGLRGEHTILLSSHILSEIERTCDRVLMLHEGKIAAQGSEDQLKTRLGTGERVELLVRGDRAALEEAIRGVEGAKIGAIKERDGALVVRVESREDVRAKVSRAVVLADLSLLGLKALSTGLEDLFVSLSKAEEPRRAEDRPDAEADEGALAEASEEEATEAVSEEEDEEPDEEPDEESDEDEGSEEEE